MVAAVLTAAAVLRGSENCRGVFEMDFFDAWLLEYVAACSPAVTSTIDSAIAELKASMNAGKERMLKSQQ